MDEHITLRKLSEELPMNRSHLRKYILSKGISPVKIRTPESGNQLTLAITNGEAEFIRESREKGGFTYAAPVDNNGGHFYLIQIVPDLDADRIKLGFETDVIARLEGHRTAAPTAELVKSWPCKRCWEKAAIDCAIQDSCELIGGEVYTCSNIDAMVERIDAFFDIMPSP